MSHSFTNIQRSRLQFYLHPDAKKFGGGTYLHDASACIYGMAQVFTFPVPLLARIRTITGRVFSKVQSAIFEPGGDWLDPRHLFFLGLWVGVFPRWGLAAHATCRKGKEEEGPPI